MNNVRELQLAELDILKQILIICERHSLRCFAIGGTMLGAIRHNGFIPWDDDIDIGFPRKDYEKFLEYAQKELPEPYQLLTSAGDYKFLFAKVHNTATTFIEHQCLEHKQWYKGVFVDIMPFDGVPNNRLSRKIYYPFVRELNKLYNYRRFGLIEGTSLKVRFANLLPAKLIYSLWSSLIRKYDFDKCKCTSFTWSVRNRKLTFHTDIFKDLILHDFEDIKIPVPRNYDEYLRTHYGDYMELPPDNERNVHSFNGVVDLENSFKNFK